VEVPFGFTNVSFTVEFSDLWSAISDQWIVFTKDSSFFPSPILILPTEDTSATSGPIKNVNNLKCVKIDRW